MLSLKYIAMLQDPSPQVISTRSLAQKVSLQPPISLQRLNELSNSGLSLLDLAQEYALLQKYAPILYFHKDEKSWPSTVEWYLGKTKLVNIDKDFVEKENVSINDLADEKYRTPSPKYYLKIKDVGTRTGEVDPIRGSLDDISAYGFVIYVGSGYVQIRYSFFYPFNGNIFDIEKVKTGLDHTIATSSVSTVLLIWIPGLNVVSGACLAEAINLRHYMGVIKGLDMHEGDWEHISLVVNLNTSKIEAVYYSAHDGGQWALPKESGGLGYAQFSTDASGRPKVYVARESHAAYPEPGEHYRPKLKGLANDLTGDAYFWDTKKNIVNLRECKQLWHMANIRWGSNKEVNPLPPVTKIFDKGLGEVFEYVAGPTTPRWRSIEEGCDVFLNRL